MEKTEPDYKGVIGARVTDLGVEIRAPWVASEVRCERIAGAKHVIQRVGMLPFPVPDKVTIVKTAGLARTHYGVAADPINKKQYMSIRSTIRGALWKTKTSINPISCLLLSDKGELDPWLLSVKKTVANWRKQVVATLPECVIEVWKDDISACKRPSGPVDALKRLFRGLGWRTEGHERVVDESGDGHDVVTWHDMVFKAVKRARQVVWDLAAFKRPNYSGVQRGVDERASTAYLKKLFKKDPQRAGALHTVMCDGWWNPDRAKRRKARDSAACVARGCPKATLDHLLWDFLHVQHRTHTETLPHILSEVTVQIVSSPSRLLQQVHRATHSPVTLITRERKQLFLTAVVTLHSSIDAPLVTT